LPCLYVIGKRDRLADPGAVRTKRTKFYFTHR
jgi:hypothetical protein